MNKKSFNSTLSANKAIFNLKWWKTSVSIKYAAVSVYKKCIKNKIYKNEALFLILNL